MSDKFYKSEYMQWNKNVNYVSSNPCRKRQSKCSCHDHCDPCCCRRCKRRKSASQSELRGIQVQLTGAEGAIVLDGQPVIFNQALFDYAKGITYDAHTGRFTLSAQGTYLVTWWVAIDGTVEAASATFAIETNSGDPLVMGSSPIFTGNISGQALVTVRDSPKTLILRNASIGRIQFSFNTPVQADLAILQVTT